jgi:hypothetical protein
MKWHNRLVAIRCNHIRDQALPFDKTFHIEFSSITKLSP